MSFAAEFAQAIQGASRILVLTHVNPDGDALGSLTAVGQALAHLGKTYTLACESDIANRFNFLPFVEQIVKKPDARLPYDLVITLDCGDDSRMGEPYDNLPEPKPPLVNIDHHVTNNHFGALNWVADCPSTAEMLYQLFCELGWEIDSGIAQSLLTGVVTDTLGFRTPNVTPNTMRVASALMEAGADLPLVTMQTLVLKPLSSLRLWQLGLNNMRLQDGLMWTSITNQEREAIGYRSESSSGLVSFLADVNRVAIGVVLLEMGDGTVRVGFRSRPPYDVASIAQALGGGGHPQAAGCTMEGPLSKAEAQVIELCQQAISQQGPVGENGRY